MRKFTMRGTVIGAIVAVCAGGGIGWAAWTVAGGAVGTAHAGQTVQLNLTSATTTGALLYPGGSGDLRVRVTNPNGFPVSIDTLVAYPPAQADQAHKTAGCTEAVTGVTIGHFNDIPVPWQLAGGATQEFTLAGAVHMSNLSDNSCQGARFTITIVLIGRNA